MARLQGAEVKEGAGDSTKYGAALRLSLINSLERSKESVVNSE